MSKVFIHGDNSPAGIIRHWERKSKQECAREILRCYDRIAQLEISRSEPAAWMFDSDVGCLVSTDWKWCEETHVIAGTGPITPLFE